MTELKLYKLSEITQTKPIQRFSSRLKSQMQVKIQNHCDINQKDEKSKQDNSNQNFESDNDQNGLNNTKTMISHVNIDEEEDMFYNQTSEIQSERRRTPNEWNVEEVCDFVTALVGSEIAGQFKWYDIDGQALDYLNVENLFNLMRIKLGPACRIKSHFDQVKKAYLDSIKFDNSN